jgi:hypothetical protein
LPKIDFYFVHLRDWSVLYFDHIHSALLFKISCLCLKKLI